MIIDIACYPTDKVDSAWRPDGPPFTGERLLKMLDGPYSVNGKPRRIDKAFIVPPEGNTLHNFDNDHLDHREGIRACMAYTVEMVKEYPDRFIGSFVFNPRYGVHDGVAELERAVARSGARNRIQHASTKWNVASTLSRRGSAAIQ